MTPRELAKAAFVCTRPADWRLLGERLTGPLVRVSGVTCRIEICKVGLFTIVTVRYVNGTPCVFRAWPLTWPVTLLKRAVQQRDEDDRKRRLRVVRRLDRRW